MPEKNVAAAAITLTPEEVKELGDLLSPARVKGERYPESMAKMANR